MIIPLKGVSNQNLISMRDQKTMIANAKFSSNLPSAKPYLVRAIYVCNAAKSEKTASRTAMIHQESKRKAYDVLVFSFFGFSLGLLGSVVFFLAFLGKILELYRALGEAGMGAAGRLPALLLRAETICSCKFGLDCHRDLAALETRQVCFPGEFFVGILLWNFLGKLNNA
jgi:hypothetical protein